MKSLNIETIIATGAADTVNGSRLAMRGLIWFAYGYHLDCNVGEVKPAAYKRKVNAALLALGRGKGEASTKSTQANVIGDAFPKLFTAQLSSEYKTIPELVAACFQEAVANDAGAVARLVDWAKHGDADYTANIKAQKAAQQEAEKQEALDAIQNAAESATAVEQPEVGFIPEIVKVQNLNIEPDVIENTIANQVADMSDEDLAQLAEIIRAEMASRANADQVAIAV